MKPVFLLLGIYMLSAVAFSQEKNSIGKVSPVSRDYLLENSHPLKKSLLTTLDLDEGYLVELLPGQIFNGWIYYWSHDGVSLGDLTEDPEVEWLIIDPNRFYSTGCTDIISVKYSFMAPMTEGKFLTTVIDNMGNSYTPITNLNITPSKWYHMAMTTSEDSDSVLIYINATEVSGFPYMFSGESLSEVYIGARHDTNNDFYYAVKGIIDEVQIWERPLSRDEIIQYMFSLPDGNESGLAIYYPFNEGWGNFTNNAVNNSG